MRVLDLFSGIGGFSLGLERAGMSTVAFCESEPYCRAVLAQHWPGLEIHTDIRELNGEQYAGNVEVVTGGFPCQPFSVAGERRGTDDDRSLWPEMCRVVREVAPTWVVAENVLGIVSLELDNVLADLEALNYACGTFIIPAVAVDAQHRRDRVWIVAHAVGERGRRGTVHSRTEDEGRRTGSNGREGVPGWREMAQPDFLKTSGAALADAASVIQRNSNQRPGRGGEASRARDDASRRSIHVADAKSARSQRHLTRTHRPTDEGIGRDSVARWPTEPDVGRVAHGIPNRAHRLRGLGNAVVPQVVESLGRMMMNYE